MVSIHYSSKLLKIYIFYMLRKICQHNCRLRNDLNPQTFYNMVVSLWERTSVMCTLLSESSGPDSVSLYLWQLSNLWQGTYMHIKLGLRYALAPDQHMLTVNFH
jgi:hypothetical protein